MSLDCVGEDAAFDVEVRCLDEHAWIADIYACCRDAIESVRQVSSRQRLACLRSAVCLADAETEYSAAYAGS